MIRASTIKTLKIDDRDFSARQEETILDVARQNGIFIPKICDLKGLSPVGACRLCLVEIKGSNKLLPACSTLVEEGMEVTTNSERLQRYRKAILELLFTERNHVCSVCVSNGHCELQTLAQKLGITHVHFRYCYPHLDVDASHDRFSVDHNRCNLIVFQASGDNVSSASAAASRVWPSTSANPPGAMMVASRHSGRSILRPPKLSAVTESTIARMSR